MKRTSSNWWWWIHWLSIFFYFFFHRTIFQVIDYCTGRMSRKNIKEMEYINIEAFEWIIIAVVVPIENTKRNKCEEKHKLARKKHQQKHTHICLLEVAKFQALTEGAFWVAQKLSKICSFLLLNAPSEIQRKKANWNFVFFEETQ